MKILLANSDRDFLNAFGRLLELSGYEVDKVFDGTQVLTRITGGGFDLVVLEQNIPRVRTKDIVGLLNEEKIPVIVILSGSVSSELLTGQVLANEYLSLPFFPSELVEAVRLEAEKRTIVPEDISAPEDIHIDVAGNTLCGRTRLTDQEIRIFKSLCAGERPEPKNIGPYINSLNRKLEGLKKRTRIRYVMNEGYKLVINHE